LGIAITTADEVRAANSNVTRIEAIHEGLQPMKSEVSILGKNSKHLLPTFVLF
jgi:hypothetical protein